ncbi:RDD family protein [Rhodobacterales bacterium LSUCC0031]|nr:RDD family protein [Rhodobacterales bacterium LSUCC0031]
MTNTLPDPHHDRSFYEGVPAKRLFAWLVDVIIVTVITFTLGLFTFSLLWWVWPMVYICVDALYRSVTIASGGATLGMRLLNIELRGPTGMRLSRGEAILHTGLFMVAIAFVLLQLISILMIALGPRHQSLPDMLIGSAAINRPG